MKTTMTPRSASRDDASNSGTVRTPRPTIAVIVLSAMMAFAPGAMAKMSKAILSDADGIIIGGSPSGTIKIESIENGPGKAAPKQVAWLGISTDEACEVLASQLGLKAGEGLVVIYVEPNSPAAKAGLQKYDVLVEMGDQMLVHPGQLRKLVRLQKEGDPIKLEFYRAGKKQSVTATLGKTMDHTDASEEILRKIPFQFSDAQNGEALHRHTSGIQSAVTHAGYNRGSANVDLQRSMEEAREALHEALMRNGNLTWVVGPGVTNLGNLNVGKGTTVTVKKNGSAAKSITKADETGTYVIVANPKKRLTVHDNDGKLIFDAEIETEEQQGKVPVEIWSKAKSMLDEMGPAKGGDSEPEARGIDDDPKS